MQDDRQRQLTSAWFNIMGAGTISGGIVSQLVAITGGASLAISIALMLLCIGAGCGLHALALRVTRGERR